MKIKIATWNMAYWSHKKYSEEAWAYFLNLDTDILLFQEARPPNSLIRDDMHLIWKEIGESRRWGSGILIKGFKTEEYKINLDQGWVNCAKVKLSEKQDLFVISLHARLKDLKSSNNPHGMVVPHLFNIFKEFTPILDSKNYVVIGGDFNADRMIDKYYYQPEGTKHSQFFDWVENDLGLINSTKEYFKDTIQTVFTPSQKYPYQDDYIFLSKNLKNKLKFCRVPDRQEIEKLSDHTPVIITLEI